MNASVNGYWGGGVALLPKRALLHTRCYQFPRGSPCRDQKTSERSLVTLYHSTEMSIHYSPVCMVDLVAIRQANAGGGGG